MKVQLALSLCALLSPTSLAGQVDYQTISGEKVTVELTSSIHAAKPDTLSIATVAMLPNRMFQITLGKPVAGIVHVVLYDINGKIIATWGNLRSAGNQVELALPPSVKGCMILRRHSGKRMVHKTIFT
jgi:hypothetical protein